MKSKNSWHGLFSVSVGRRSHEDRIAKHFDNDCRTRGRKLKGRIFSSLALILNVYAKENYLCDDQNYFFLSTISKAYESLINVFSPSDLAHENSQDFSSTINQPKLWYPTVIVSKYLQDCQRMNENSLCKSMMSIAAGEPRVFLVGQGSSRNNHMCMETRENFLNVACVLIKLKKYLKHQYQSTTSIPKLQLKVTKDKCVSATVSSQRCDRGVQCSKNTEYLKVAPDVKFFSRSSLVIKDKPLPTLQRRNRARHVSSPSLEYVACYKPEMLKTSRRADEVGPVPRLRSFSSSAIFGLESDAGRRRTGYDGPAERCYPLHSPRNLNKNRSRRTSRGASERRLRETIRCTEDEILRYSNFIESDLASFHHTTIEPELEKSRSRGLNRDDVLAVKKILLEDYITEVKEIIRAESRRIDEERESRVLDSIKQRMDDDLKVESVSAEESWHSLESACKSGVSYATARTGLETERFRCCCCCRKNSCRCLTADDGRGDSLTLRSCKSCSTRTSATSACYEKLKSCSSCIENKTAHILNSRKYEHTAKSTRSSVDSGVLLDSPSRWPSSDDSVVSVGVDTGIPKESASASLSSSSENIGCGNDEALCQRVETAVRKFTEELILCERRVRDRSRLLRRRRRRSAAADKTRPRTPPTTDQSVVGSAAGFNCLRNSRCSSEDERIAGISTPSLVSLSDSELPT